MPNAGEIARYADEILRVAEINDWPNALNGLQIENSGRATKIGAAVDASTQSLRSAAEQGIDFLIVHHGLFWPGLRPATGPLRRQLKIAFESDIALYSVHLPLDLHPTLGNNAQLAHSLGLQSTTPFLPMKGELVGLRAEASVALPQLVQQLEHSLGTPVRTFACGPQRTQNIGIVTGGAGDEIYAVAGERIDTFITGEASHWAAVAAQELGVNLLLGGHYATETFGVKALAAHLSERFQLPWQFIDLPTGL